MACLLCLCRPAWLAPRGGPVFVSPPDQFSLSPDSDSHSPDGTVLITWKDGQAMTYRLVTEGFPFSTLRDSLGGIWQREILVQGNAVFTNPANGNRIVVPLR
jgi:hypothetical protein